MPTFDSYPEIQGSNITWSTVVRQSLLILTANNKLQEATRSDQTSPMGCKTSTLISKQLVTVCSVVTVNYCEIVRTHANQLVRQHVGSVSQKQDQGRADGCGDEENLGS